MIYTDNSENRLTITNSGKTRQGKPLLICRIEGVPEHGYIALDECSAFGTEDFTACYGMPCMTWFGPGERYPDAEAAIDACGTRIVIHGHSYPAPSHFTRQGNKLWALYDGWVYWGRANEEHLAAIEAAGVPITLDDQFVP